MEEHSHISQLSGDANHRFQEARIARLPSHEPLQGMANAAAQLHEEHEENKVGLSVPQECISAMFVRYVM